MKVSPAAGGSGLTPRRHTLSSRIAIMCSGSVRVGAQHPPGPGPRRVASAPSQSPPVSAFPSRRPRAEPPPLLFLGRPPRRSWSRGRRPAPPGSSGLTSSASSSQERPRTASATPGLSRDLRWPWQSASSLRPTQQLDPALQSPLWQLPLQRCWLKCPVGWKECRTHCEEICTHDWLYH